MEVKDWIMIISAFALVVGWFVNSHLTRLNEIAKKRIDYRLHALHSILEMWYFIEKTSAPFTDSQFPSILKNTRIKINLYGKDDEIKEFEIFIQNCKQGNLQDANISLQKMVPLVRDKIRIELKI